MTEAIIDMISTISESIYKNYPTSPSYQYVAKLVKNMCNRDDLEEDDYFAIAIFILNARSSKNFIKNFVKPEIVDKITDLNWFDAIHYISDLHETNDYAYNSYDTMIQDLYESLGQEKFNKLPITKTESSLLYNVKSKDEKIRDAACAKLSKAYAKTILVSKRNYTFFEQFKDKFIERYRYRYNSSKQLIRNKDFLKNSYLAYFWYCNCREEYLCDESLSFITNQALKDLNRKIITIKDITKLISYGIKNIKKFKNEVIDLTLNTSFDEVIPVMNGTIFLIKKFSDYEEIKSYSEEFKNLLHEDNDFLIKLFKDISEFFKTQQPDNDCANIHGFIDFETIFKFIQNKLKTSDCEKLKNEIDKESIIQQSISQYNHGKFCTTIMNLCTNMSTSEIIYSDKLITSFINNQA